MATAGIKFRVLIARDGFACTLTCDDLNHAESLKAYLNGRFPAARLSGPEVLDHGPYVRIRIDFDNTATPFAVRQALVRHPSAVTVGLFVIPVSEQPHFRVSAENLAQWLDRQGEEPWWTADGDPVLMSRIAFPAPPDEVATELRKIGGSLLAIDPQGVASAQELGAMEVDRACTVDDWGNRFFTFTWNGVPIEWQLIEDEPTSESHSE